MACVSHLVRLNYIYQIESITPTFNSRKAFKYLDPIRFPDGVPDNSGGIRRFNVEFAGDSPANYTSRYDRHDIMNFSVTLFYPHTVGSMDKVHEYMFNDKFDVIKRLRDTTYLVGYSDSNPTTDIQHKKRQYEGSTRQPEIFDNVDALTLNFTSHVFEVESA